MSSNIRVKVKLKGDVAKVRSLMLHPMETGARKDSETKALIPAHYITQLSFVNNGRIVMETNCSTAVSKDPYFSFSFKGASVGDTLLVKWVDNKGGSESTEIIIK